MPKMAALIVGLALLGCTSTSIEGKVIVGPGPEGLAVVAVLWQNQLGPLDPTDPFSPMVEQPVALGQLAVGTTVAEGGEFPFAFHTLSKGSYLVGAFIDLNDDRQVTSDELAIDLSAPPLEIDPDDPEKTKATRDVYLRMSAPDRLTLSGVLHRSAAAAARDAEILVLDKPLTEASAMVVARQTIPAGGQDVAWTLFNVPPGLVHVLATDDLSLQGHVSLHAGNPVALTLEGSREISSIDVWMDRQAPGLGSVSGQVQLNAVLPGVRVQLWLFGADPTEVDEAPLLGWVNASGGSSLSLPFQFTSVPLRTLYLAGGIMVDEPGGRTLSTTRVYKAGNDPSPIELTVQSPARTDVVLPMGVGRVSGTITVENAKKDLGLWTFAMVEGETRPQPQQYDLFLSPSEGTVQVPYVMFGLEDGKYRMQLVPDTSGVDGPNDELSLPRPFVFDGTPAEVEIVAGGREVSNFSVKLNP